MTESAPIVHYLYEPGDGGLDRVAIILANGMAARGIATELWMTKRDGPLAHMIAPDVTVRIVPTPDIGNRGLQLAIQIPVLAKMIAKHRTRAIFSAGNQSNLSLALARNRSGHRATKIIQKITNPVMRPGKTGLALKLRRWRFGKTAELGDLCLTLSQADARSYTQMFPNAANKFQPVFNAYVTPAMLAAGENRVTGKETPTRLLAVGRIAVQKDYATMVRALSRVNDLPWTLTVLGNGPLMDETKALASQLNIADRIDFKGFVPDATPFYAASDLLLLSSKWEGFAAVPLEAMAAGCGVVATDSSAGLTELLAASGQKTVPIGDAMTFGEAIRNALSEPVASGQLRSVAASYAIDNSIDDHLRLLNTL